MGKYKSNTHKLRCTGMELSSDAGAFSKVHIQVSHLHLRWLEVNTQASSEDIDIE